MFSKRTDKVIDNYVYTRGEWEGEASCIRNPERRPARRPAKTRIRRRPAQAEPSEGLELTVKLGEDLLYDCSRMRNCPDRSNYRSH